MNRIRWERGQGWFTDSVALVAVWLRVLAAAYRGLWRPTLGLVICASVFYAFVVGPLIKKPVSLPDVICLLTASAHLVEVRRREKQAGQA